jgi:DNA-binding NtrC family response regulator
VVTNHRDVPVLMMTAHGNLEAAVTAIRVGAWDFLTKPPTADALVQAIERAVEMRHLRLEVRRLRHADGGHEATHAILTRSAPMQTICQLVDRVAESESSVLVTGESGTGKELVARALHRHSARRQRPFVAVDCTSLTETLLESELFGHVKGSFTGAVQDAPGLFAEADGGTIFLDEIGEITPPLQAKLLRVLQEHQVRPVGGAQWRSVDVRVVAATNRDLAGAAASGEFREDLYYRLKVVTISLPPLRERREDISLLVDHLVRRAATQCGKPVSALSDAALAVLHDYDWPGNVRELAHVLERSVALAQDAVISVDDLPADLRGGPPPAVPTDLVGDRPTLEELKQRYIRHVFDESGGNVSRAAAVLGLERRSLYRMLRRYGIARPGDED